MYLIRWNYISWKNSPFHEKPYNAEIFGKKSLSLTVEHFFPIFEIMQWNGIINKEGFLN